MGGTLNAMAFIAECAWKQGVDLYSELDNRLLACGEHFARNTFTTALPLSGDGPRYGADQRLLPGVFCG